FQRRSSRAGGCRGPLPRRSLAFPAACHTEALERRRARSSGRVPARSAMLVDRRRANDRKNSNLERYRGLSRSQVSTSLTRRGPLCALLETLTNLIWDDPKRGPVDITARGRVERLRVKALHQSIYEMWLIRITKLVTLMLAGSLLLSLNGRWHYVLDNLSSFRPPFVPALLICCVVFLIARERAWLAASAIGLAVGSASVVPWYVPSHRGNSAEGAP